MRNWHLSRRSFLRGSGGGLLGLPLLDVMESRSAIAAAAIRPPVRMGCIYLPNGVPLKAWKPESDEVGALKSLNHWMTAFQPYAADLQFLSGLQSETKGSHPGAGATWLVRPCPEGDLISRNKSVGGASMDQIVARSVGGETPFASLELISNPEGSHSKDLLRNNISWRNGTTPVPRETQPQAVFDRLTGRNEMQTGTDHSPQRQRILDTVLEDAKSLRRRISSQDKHKIDEYLESVRSVEKRLNARANQSRSAARDRASTFPRPPDHRPDDHGEYLRLMFDMLVLAYWTDSTRVSTFMLDHEQTNRYFDFLPGVKGMWHALSHWRDVSGKTEDDDGKTSWSSREVKFEQYLKVIEYHHQQVAYFLGRLKAIKEGDGSLLDHCMILYGSPFSDGNEHLSQDLPMLIAGRAGGKINPGRVLNHKGGPAEGVYLSMMDVMGVTAAEIGGVDQVIAIT